MCVVRFIWKMLWDLCCLMIDWMIQQIHFVEVGNDKTSMPTQTTRRSPKLIPSTTKGIKDSNYWNDFEFWPELILEMLSEWKTLPAALCFMKWSLNENNIWILHLTIIFHLIKVTNESCVLMNLDMPERISSLRKHDLYMENTKPYQTWTGNPFLFGALVESIL